MENLVTSTANALENTREQGLYRMTVTADEELMQMIDRMKELTGNAPLATILKRACGSYLKQHCHKERQKRPEARKVTPTKQPAKAATVAPVKPGAFGISQIEEKITARRKVGVNPSTPHCG